MNNLLIRYFLLFLGAILLQATVVNYIEIFTSKPDLILIALVIFSLNMGPAAGSSAGFLVGIISDLISGNVVGVGALAKSITGYVAGSASRFFQERSQFIFTLFISGFMHDLVLFGVKNLGQDISWQVILFFQIVPNLSYTAVIGTFIYFLIGRMLKSDENAYY